MVDVEDPSNYCLIGFAKSSETMFLVGDVMLNNYYSVWDDDNNQMALVPHVESLATVTVATIPDTIYTLPKYAYPFSYGKFGMYVGGSYALTSGMSFLAYFFYIRTK